jgi:DNA mismatch repair ATPase MutL
MMAEGVPPDAYSMQALLRAAFFTKQGLAAVRAVRREMQRHRVQLNRKLGTAMLCCLRHVRVPAAEGDPTAALLPGSQPRPSVRQQPQQQHQSQQHQLQQYDQQHHQSQQQQQQQQQYQQQQRPRVDERAECLAEAAAVFAEMRAQAAQQRSPLDLRAYNSLLLVQLAAADHEGVLSTFRELEGEESLRPDATTLGIVISTCQAEGWLDEAEQYQQLLEGSRLLGALQGDEYEGSYHRSYHQRRA